MSPAARDTLKGADPIGCLCVIASDRGPIGRQPRVVTPSYMPTLEIKLFF